MKTYALIFLGYCLSLMQDTPSSKELNANPISQTVPPKEVVYQFMRKGASSVNFSGQTARLKQATALAKNLTNPEISLERLQNQFSRGIGFKDSLVNNPKKKIRNKVAASSMLKPERKFFQQLLDDILVAQTKEVFPKKDGIATKGKAGKIHRRWVNNKGLEYDQVFVKALIGGLVFDQAMNGYLNKLDGNAQNPTQYRQANDKEQLVAEKNYTKMEHHWDEAYGYVFGLDKKTDKLLHKYIYKVDKNKHFKGIAHRIKNAFYQGRKAVVAKDYVARDKYIQMLRKDLAKVIAIRAVHYLEAGIRKSQKQVEKGFHNLSEGYGLVVGLAFVSLDGKTPLFAPTQIKEMLNELQQGDGFWTPSTLAPIVRKITTTIASKFDFSLAQV